MSLPHVSPLKRIYTIDEAKDAVGFTRPSWYRGERRGFISLIRIASRTFVPADVIERMLSGELQLPTGLRGKQLNTPAKLKGRKGGRPRKHALPEPAPAAE
jgi:hypothetical protein